MGDEGRFVSAVVAMGGGGSGWDANLTRPIEMRLTPR
jgi:hypothetical protein